MKTGAILFAAVSLVAWTGGVVRAAETPPGTVVHTDPGCGIEVTIPEGYHAKIAGSPDACRTWILVRAGTAGERDWLIALDVEELGSAWRQTLAETGPVSVERFALHLAALRCSADGPDGSVHCADGVVRRRFRTAGGLSAWELELTEIEERWRQDEPHRVERRAKGPVFALDLSDPQTMRVLIASPVTRMAPAGPHAAAMRAIVERVRIVGPARRRMPLVVPLEPARPDAVLVPALPVPHRAPRR
jgi:hypothetical protein